GFWAVLEAPMDFTFQPPFLAGLSGYIAEVGKPFVEARPGDRIDGRLVRRIDLASGRFALVENAKEFTLVPWRPVLENQLGKSASGIMRADGVSWRFGRGRAGPEIS
ncbi:DUF3363 domain-containing protein, partial [Rhizorhabdus dicambivorans]